MRKQRVRKREERKRDPIEKTRHDKRKEKSILSRRLELDFSPKGKHKFITNEVVNTERNID